MNLEAHVHVDMEQYSVKDLTYNIFKEVAYEPEFRDWRDFGIVSQAYLKETEADLEELLRWVRQRGTPIVVRLVKGAYWDYEVLFAGQMDWPIPVWTKKPQSDACYERCTRFLMANHEWLVPAIGSHNARSLAHAMAAAEQAGAQPDAWEAQVLHGMAGPLQEALTRMGRRVRVYTPYGAMLPGMAYLVRRLLENTSNDSFLKATLVKGKKASSLLANPEESPAMKMKSTSKNPVRRTALGPFKNEPATDFIKPQNREAMFDALRQVRANFGKTYPLLINGQTISTVDTIVSTNPSNRSEVVGSAASATVEHADLAVAAARKGFREWSQVDPEDRAAIIVKAAEIIRARHLEFAALIILEAAKGWREADVEVGEALDFCEFYAREMLRLNEPRRRDVPGETNETVRVPRGVAVVIPPWNFPLAIPLGMTVAALVAGNTVVLKPAEQTPVIAAKLVEALHEAGVPKSALHYVPGVGEVAGKALVEDKRVDIVAFTGSMAVGLEINKTAATTASGQDHVKRVIAEMGGKNAIIVDDDADLDEAVVGAMQSAFGYSGQKCSACSRVIVLESVHDAFLARLAEAVKSLPVGASENPDVVVGPLIDQDAVTRVNQYIQIAAQEGTIVSRIDPGPAAEKGNFVGPVVVANLKPTSRLAQEEIFGPVLSVIKAENLDDALEIALGVPYALTGGIYSRSPANIQRAKREFRVGNLYINRSITGAFVDRQPFGGFKLSGVGAKAGGPDYLIEFMLMRSISENTLRRGFAPELESLSELEPESEAAVAAGVRSTT